MNDDKLYQNFLKRYQEVMAVPPQTVGPFTPAYKKLIPLFKTAPWRILVPLAILLIAAVFFFHTWTVSEIATILQTAF